MRKIIAGLQMSLDGFIEGSNGELDWAKAEDEEMCRDLDETLGWVDAFILGRGMYPAYEQYWLALLANPTGTKNENAYARLADKIPHIVLSKSLDNVAWKITRIVWDVQRCEGEIHLNLIQVKQLKSGKVGLIYRSAILDVVT